jgi:DNA polymerase III subunit delta
MGPLYCPPMAAVSFKPLKTVLETGGFAPVYVFHGADDHLKEEWVRQVVGRATDPSTRDFNFDTLRGAEVDVSGLSAALEALPMLAERRVVILRDPAALKKAQKERLEQYLAKPAADTVLLLVVPSGAKADAALLKKGEAFEFKPLEGDDLLKWIHKEASGACGTSITDGAAQRLASYTGSDLPMLAGELRKLAAYANGGPIDDAAVEAVTGVRPGVTLADLLDRAAQRDTTGAIAIVRDVLAQPKQSGVTTVMALTAQVLAIGWGVAARARGLAQSRLESEFFGLLKESGSVYTGRAWGDAVKCWARAVPKWSLDDVARALPHLHAADAALKDTKVSSEAQIVTSLLLAITPPAGARRAA